VVRVIGISSLVAAVPILVGVLQVNDWYVAYHDQRYVLRGEAITVADASSIRTELDLAQIQRTDTAEKLDRLILSQARTVMWAADDRLRELRARGATVADIREAEKDLERATEYYECLRAAGTDCERLNGT
jgi:hypothetical protein